jgi:hypothetical protein
MAAVLLLAGAPSLASAQLPGGITGGIKGGITFGNIPNFAEDLDAQGADTEMRMGLIAGGFAMMSFDDMFGLQVEGLFNQKGFEYEFGADEFDVRLDYIEIPVLFRVQVAQAKGVYALVGPSFGFNVKAASSSEIGDIEQSVDIDDSIAGFEMSLAVAVGYQTGRFLVEGRYMEGLTNVLENATDTMNYKTRTFAVLGGFRF